MEIRTFGKGEVIFRQGDSAESMFDILSGSVGIYVAHGTEEENRLTELQSGDFLGEMGLIECYPRSATAVALEDETVLQEIEEKEFAEYFKSRPVRLLGIMRQLSRRLRDRSEDYMAACRVLEGLKETQAEPEKRSGMLLDKVRELLACYNRVMNAAYQTDNGTYIPYAFLYREHI